MMFTGIVQELGRVLDVENGRDQLRVCIASQFTQVALGESIAVNGVCLTATECSPDGKLYFYVSSETLQRSNLGTLQQDSTVNLERALLATERLSGHIVQGHVDAQARLISSRKVGESMELTFEIPQSLSRYCIEKGSIALNGISLTLNRIQETEIAIMVIPHTWEKTNLSRLNPGDRVNVEVDVLAKYVERLLKEKSCPQ